MIQRIQTLYLLVVALLTGATLLLPLAWFGSGAETFTLHAFALKDGAGEAVHSTPYMGALLAAATLLPLATIFLFKRRMLQLRLCAVELVLLLGAVAMEAIYYYLSYRVFADMEFHTQGMRPAIALPAVCLLFGYLAARAILRDELLVRSLDRIR